MLVGGWPGEGWEIPGPPSRRGGSNFNKNAHVPIHRKECMHVTALGAGEVGPTMSVDPTTSRDPNEWNRMSAG